MKAFLLSICILIAGQACYAQAHDESFRAGDPAKLVQVYPNPATDYLIVRFEAPVAKTSKLAFHSIIGSSIELEQEVIDDFEVHVKVKDLPTGYYVIMVHEPQSNSRGIYKFLKK
jgi:hypothetical protein